MIVLYIPIVKTRFLKNELGENLLVIFLSSLRHTSSWIHFNQQRIEESLQCCLPEDLWLCLLLCVIYCILYQFLGVKIQLIDEGLTIQSGEDVILFWIVAFITLFWDFIVLFIAVWGAWGAGWGGWVAGGVSSFPSVRLGIILSSATWLSLWRLSRALLGSLLALFGFRISRGSSFSCLRTLIGKIILSTPSIGSLCPGWLRSQLILIIQIISLISLAFQAAWVIFILLVGI